MPLTMPQRVAAAAVAAALFASGAEGRFLASNASAPATASKAAVVKPHANASASPASDVDELKKLTTGLKAIEGLRSSFSAMTDGEQDDGSKFANGALSEELGRKDSKVWATLQDMLSKTVTTMGQMKDKPKAEREKMMQSLEKDLDGKAGQMMNLTADVTKKQYAQDEEYLLGLLNMHSQWSFDQQLNATETFDKGSPLIAELVKHHDASKPLAPQLATLMDAAHTTKKAATALIQLVGELRQQ